MKRIILPLLLLFASTAVAADVTTIVFGQTSSAKTSTANLQVKVMTSKMRVDDNRHAMQGFALQSGNTYNYFLTKTQSFTVTDAMIAMQIYAANDVTLKVNAETAYITIPAGETRTYVLR